MIENLCYDKEYYIFDCLLPYAIKLPRQSELDFTYEGSDLKFIHCERLQSAGQNIVLPENAHVASDSFGQYFRSRIALVFEAHTIKGMMPPEAAEVFDVETFFSSRFFNASNNTDALVVGALNRVLQMVRALLNDWHASPLTARDLSQIRFFKQVSGKTLPLGSSFFSHQMLDSSPEQTETNRAFELVKQALGTEGSLDPLAIIECQIHDLACRGDYFLSIILMGTLVELALKKHLIRFLTFEQDLSLEEAEHFLRTKKGNFPSIGKLVDEQSDQVCLVEKYIGWIPYTTDEYKIWRTLVRDRRNSALHEGPIRLSQSDGAAAWDACCKFIMLSFRESLQALLTKGVDLAEDEYIFWFHPLSRNLFPMGLIGPHSENR
jgi:hypothetical protein